MTKDPITSPQSSAEELKSEALLRPKTLDEFVGQTELKENLKVFIQDGGSNTLAAAILL